MLMLLLALTDTPEKAALVTRLYEAYEPQVLKMAFDVLHDQLDAEEATLEAYENLIKRLGHLDTSDEISLRGYLFVAAKNIAINMKKQKEKADYIEEMPFIPSSDNPHETIENDEALYRIKRMIYELPPNLREVLTLTYALNQSPCEIAALIGKTVSTVYRMIARGKKLLKEQLREEEQDENGFRSPDPQGVQ